MTVVLAAHSVPAARAAGGRGERNTAAAMTTSMPATRKAFRDIAPPLLCEPRIVRAEPGAPAAPGGKPGAEPRAAGGAVSRLGEDGVGHGLRSLEHREVDAGRVGRVHAIVCEHDLSVLLPVLPDEARGRLVLALQ